MQYIYVCAPPRRPERTGCRLEACTVLLPAGNMLRCCCSLSYEQKPIIYQTDESNFFNFRKKSLNFYLKRKSLEALYSMLTRLQSPVFLMLLSSRTLKSNYYAFSKFNLNKLLSAQTSPATRQSVILELEALMKLSTCYIHQNLMGPGPVIKDLYTLCLHENLCIKQDPIF